MYSLPNTNIIRMMRSRWVRWVEHVEHIGKMKNADRILVGKLDGKKQLGRYRHRWEDNIKMDL
jgi:hypothetical protein